MMMAAEPADLDRLIEEGLTLYGQGNLDGALLVWERVLAADPENAQALSYVAYVRTNYELLTSDLGDEDAGPFGIASDGEPEYLIEISPGEAPALPTRAPLYMDPLDEGWSIGDDQPARAAAAPVREETVQEPIEMVNLELEADEPGIDEPGTHAGPSFEGSTREYSRGPTEFGPEATPGFGTETTDVRRKDLGFVKPRSAPDAGESSRQNPPEPPRKRTASAGPPELKITLRTPQHGDEAVTSELVPSAPYDDAYELSYGDPGAPAEDVDDDDLISSLPSPRPVHVTRDLPIELVPPRQQAALDALEPVLPDSELAPDAPRTQTNEQTIAVASKHTTDFSDKPTQQVGRPDLDSLISAPTRELGLRTPSGGRTITEDQPTVTVRSDKGGPDPLDLEPEQDQRGTNTDAVLPFDPIDARAALIIDEIDRDASSDEPKEDKIRRRITSLIERAQDWSDADQLDKAVAAVDLALSEDPNSALAQKLIHRNRDTIMSVFQNFLGNLDRQPTLARPLHELSSAPISPRAAFLLSRVDGSLSLDEILDVSGMPRLEAYRYLCQLFLRGILR